MEDNIGQQLFVAAGSGNVEETHKYASMEGVDLEYQDISGDTPFTEAVRNYKFDAALALLEYDVNINHQNKYGRNALHLTSNADFFIFLVKQGVDYNALDKENNSVFMHVFDMDKDKQFSMIEALMDKGLVIDKQIVTKVLVAGDIVSKEVQEWMKQKEVEFNLGWKSLNKYKISYLEAEGNRELTSIFNFQSMTVKEITRNLSTDAETVLKFHFSDKTVDKTMVLEALEEHKKNNGVVRAADVYNSFVGGNNIESSRLISRKKITL